MRIAPDPARERVLPCEFERADVARRGYLAGVEHLHDVELRREALERGPVQVAAAVPAEGMRDVREPALVVDEIDRALGSLARRHSRLEVKTDEFTFRGGDLLADDHLKTCVHLAEPQATLDRVVIGDADRTELRRAGELGEVGQPDAAVA